MAPLEEAGYIRVTCGRRVLVSDGGAQNPYRYLGTYASVSERTLQRRSFPSPACQVHICSCRRYLCGIDTSKYTIPH